MENELVKTDDVKEFNKTLDAVTGFGDNNKWLPVIKFDAVNGIFVRSDNDKDEEGKVIYPTELGKQVELHIINCAFQLVSSGEKSDVYVYSKEYTGQEVKLLNGKNIEAYGKYKDLKEKYDLRYKKVLYAYIGEEMVRIFLSGFGLTGWFPFLQANGNPVRYNTVLQNSGERFRGHKDKAPTIATEKDIELYNKDPKKINLFYGLAIKKQVVAPQDIIVDRVNKVNKYLINKNSNSPITTVPEEAKQIDNTNPPVETQINEEDLPFVG